MTWVSKLFKECLAREKLTHGYPGHLTDLTALQVQVVVKGALGTRPGLTPTLIRWLWRCEVVLKLNTCLAQRN